MHWDSDMINRIPRAFNPVKYLRLPDEYTGVARKVAGRTCITELEIPSGITIDGYGFCPIAQDLSQLANNKFFIVEKTDTAKFTTRAAWSLSAGTGTSVAGVWLWYDLSSTYTVPPSTNKYYPAWYWASASSVAVGSPAAGTYDCGYYTGDISSVGTEFTYNWPTGDEYTPMIGIRYK
jgi:hypothetical protein